MTMLIDMMVMLVNNIMLHLLDDDDTYTEDLDEDDAYAGNKYDDTYTEDEDYYDDIMG